MLLEWLSKEETSAYGECRGNVLNVLLDAGFAKLGPPDSRGHDYRRVRLTDAGRKRLTES